MENSVPALEVSNVSYRIDGRRILTAINWIVQRGEHWVLLGANGSGKTTLLKLACGFIWPNAGGVVYRQGSDRVDLRELRKSIGWVTASLSPEIPRREPMLRTVVSGKFAQIGLLELSSIHPTEEDFDRAEFLLETLGCGYLKDQRFGTLSQGEQQKALIARAMMTQPYLIFLDEPCAGLDPGARENLLETLQNLAGTAAAPALIYVTHHVEEILPIFGKTLVLKAGEVFRSGRTDEIVTDDLLQELYGTPLCYTKTRGRFWPVPVRTGEG